MPVTEKELEEFEEKVSEIIEDILNYFKNTNPAALIKINKKSSDKEELYRLIDKFFKLKNVSNKYYDAVRQRLDSTLFGYYVLQELIDDDNISDIRCLGPDIIFYKSLGKRYKADIRFKDEEDYKNFISITTIKNNNNLGFANAMTKFTDTTSSDKFILRIDISSEILTSSGCPFLHIRKHSKNKKTLDDLMNAKPFPMLTKEVRDFLSYQAKKGTSMIVCGPNGSGKTHLLNACIEEYPLDKSGFCVQESEELFSKTHENIIFLHTLENREICYDLKTELKQGLIADNDLFIIGEIRDETALYVLNASYTGSTCWLTTHAESSVDATQKLADYAMYEAKYPIEMILKELCSMDMVIFVKDFQIEEISMIAGFDENAKRIVFDTIYDINKNIDRLDEYMEEGMTYVD